MAELKSKLKVEGMSCQHCKMAVEKALKNLNGVSETEVNIESGLVSVAYDSSLVQYLQLVEAIEEAGYSVQK